MRRALLLYLAAAGCASADRGGRTMHALAVQPPFSSTSSPEPVVASDACPEAKAPFLQPIAIVEDLKIPRWPPVVGFPIAFSRGADVRSLNGFYAAASDGTPLPTQLEVLSRWGDGPVGCAAPIRWAYAFVLAAAPPGQRSILALRHDPDTPRTGAPGPVLRITDTKDQVKIDTGPARFTIRKDRFDGIASVELETATGRKTIVSGMQMIVERGDERFTPAEGRRLAFEIERRGPEVATIAVKGTYANKAGAKIFRYTMRLHFYAGTAAVEIDHTYYNGELFDERAHGGKNRTASDRVYLRIPLALEGSLEVDARLSQKKHILEANAPISVQQDKRTPSRTEVISSILRGEESVELGTYADDPMLGVVDKPSGLYAIATIGDMGPRDPQALRFDPKSRSIDVDWQSEELHIGGGRGIWSNAVLEFGEKNGVDLFARGHALYAHASRPLVGAPSTAYLNTTKARGSLPEKELPDDYRRFDEWIDRVHDETAGYLRKFRITGTQIWPDLPRRRGNEKKYFEGGDCNYWDWSTVELEEFLRTADPSFLFDFAIPEAITMAETVSFRPDRPGSSFGGFSPCYGGATDDAGAWHEGLNHRIGNCPGDYSYNKVHKLAYVLTADRRFTDFFTEGAETAIRMYKDPSKDPIETWLELSASRTVYQYLEPLLDAAEFSRIGGDAENRRYRDAALAYFDHMQTRALERGHTCFLLGTGFDDPKKAGDCTSDQAWMTPVWMEWVARIGELYAHAPAKAWLLDFAKMSAARLTVLGDDGTPDIRAIERRSSDDAKNGWRTMYRCKAGPSGVEDATCQRHLEIENEGYFYPNGLVAYLNSYGVVLDAHPEDPLGICRWLPDAYRIALARMAEQMNGYVWGKELGQAFALSQTTLAAIARCPSR
jgi:hypothetical protein